MVMVMVALRPLQDSLPLQLPSPMVPDWRRQKLFSIQLLLTRIGRYTASITNDASLVVTRTAPSTTFITNDTILFNTRNDCSTALISNGAGLCSTRFSRQLPLPMMPFWPKFCPGLDGSEQELSAVQLLFPMKPLWLSHEPPSIQLSSPIWCQSAADKIWEIYNFYFQWCHSGWNKQGLMYSFHSQWSHSGFHKMRTNN